MKAWKKTQDLAFICTKRSGSRDGIAARVLRHKMQTRCCKVVPAMSTSAIDGRRNSINILLFRQGLEYACNRAFSTIYRLFSEGDNGEASAIPDV